MLIVDFVGVVRGFRGPTKGATLDLQDGMKCLLHLVLIFEQQVLNPAPHNPAPATWTFPKVALLFF